MLAVVAPSPLRRRGNGLRAGVLGALLLLLPACERQPPAVDPARAAATSALDRGLAALAGAPALGNIGTAWMLQRLQAVAPDARLAALLARSRPALRADPYARLLDASLAPVALPADPGRGVGRFAAYMLAPVGAPPQRAAAYLAALLAGDEQGYVLTHQLLALLWAEEFGVALPPDAAAIRARLTARIIAEQQAAPPQFSDLYAERAALALFYGHPPAADAAGWIAVIVAAQRADGRWVDDAASQIVYDGQKAPAVHEWTHTSGFAVAALAAYLRGGAPDAADP